MRHIFRIDLLENKAMHENILLSIFGASFYTKNHSSSDRIKNEAAVFVWKLRNEFRLISHKKAFQNEKNSIPWQDGARSRSRGCRNVKELKYVAEAVGT